MTERIVEIPAKGTFETPKGWRVIEYYSGVFSGGGRPTSVRITDDPQVYKPENVVWGEGEFHVREGATQAICGVAATSNDGWLCSYEPHETGPHSWEPIDLVDINIGRGELHPEYYQTEAGLQPWDVIKAFQLDYWRGTAVRYLLRAGRKPSNEAIEDIRKAWTFLGERLRDLEKEQNPLHVIRGSNLPRGPIVAVQYGDGSAYDVEQH